MKTIERYEINRDEAYQQHRGDNAFATAYSAYGLAKKWGCDCPVIDSTVWERDAEAAAREFKENGFDEILYVYAGSNYLETLMVFQNEGYVINGMTMLQTDDPDTRATYDLARALGAKLETPIYKSVPALKMMLES
ncbi:hypothetical protein FACS1894184_14070 [Clostridia bacterium]|nr:hypothetical protein FACS1894184_14070 [Clostridia bacterium]